MSAGLLGSAFALALVSALHCVGMCGAFALVARAGPAWQGGKLLSYALLGAVAGGLGRAVSAAAVGPGLTIAVAILASAILVLSALQLAGRLPRSLGGSRVGSWLARPLRRLAEAQGRSLTVRRLLFGLANGLIPCGVVYGGLALAAVAGGALQGAGVMVAFGLGTIPATTAVVLGASPLTRLGERPRLRAAAAIIVLLIGLVSVWWRTPLHAAVTAEEAMPACHRATP